MANIPVEIVPLTAEYIDQCKQLVNYCFCKYEPLTMAAGMAEDEFGLYSNWAIDKAEDCRRLSAVAVVREDDAGDGNANTTKRMRVVGFAITFRDSTTPPEFGTECHTKDGANEALLIALEHAALERPENADLKTMDLSKRAKLSLLGCLPEFGRGGVATRLVEWTVQRARDLNYHAVVAEATNPRSLRVFQKTGFRLRAFVPLQTFQFDGTLPFAGVTASTQITLLTKDVRGNARSLPPQLATRDQPVLIDMSAFPGLPLRRNSPLRKVPAQLALMMLILVFASYSLILTCLTGATM